MGMFWLHPTVDEENVTDMLLEVPLIAPVLSLFVQVHVLPFVVERPNCVPPNPSPMVRLTENPTLYSDDWLRVWVVCVESVWVNVLTGILPPCDCGPASNSVTWVPEPLE